MKFDDQKLVDFIKKHENLRQKTYRDSREFDTIGWGHLLADYENYDNGITIAEAETLLALDILHAFNDAKYLISNFDCLSSARQAVVIDMCFNLGRKKFSKFTRTIAAIETSDFVTAANEMKNSDWYNQVKTRAVEDCNMMRRGSWL